MDANSHSRVGNWNLARNPRKEPLEPGTQDVLPRAEAVAMMPFFSKKRISALLNIFEGLGWREVIKVRPRVQIPTGNRKISMQGKRLIIEQA